MIDEDCVGIKSLPDKVLLKIFSFIPQKVSPNKQENPELTLSPLIFQNFEIYYFPYYYIILFENNNVSNILSKLIF